MLVPMLGFKAELDFVQGGEILCRLAGSKS